MATLNCNSCGGHISSNARRVQCPHCGELFPFVCARCDHKLRPAFPVFDDERYLSLDAPPQPLCDDHYLRKCPDCDNWFGADENPGYFRCAGCAEIQARQKAELPEDTYAPPAPSAGNGRERESPAGGVATRSRSASGIPNVAVIGFAVCAFIALIAWMLLGR